MRALPIAILALAVSSPAAAQQWSDPDLGGRVAEGVATQRFIWLRGSNDSLVRFDRASGERTLLATDAIDILADGPRLWALFGDRDGYTFNIRDLRAEAMTSVRFGTEGRPIAMTVADGTVPGVLATTSYAHGVGDGWRRTPLAAALNPFAHVATTASGTVYAGYNRGEWGGGLRHIDPATGSVSFVSEPGKDICGGTHSLACAPVVGLFRDPAAPDCVIVGTGISHLGISYGSVSQVCGNRISPVFVTPTPPEPDRWMMGPRPWPLDALVQTSDGWIGLSRDRYFRSRHGYVEEQAMPEFEDWAGLRLSREVDRVLFLVSACCWGSVDDPTLYSTLAVPVID